MDAASIGLGSSWHGADRVTRPVTDDLWRNQAQPWTCELTGLSPAGLELAAACRSALLCGRRRRGGGWQSLSIAGWQGPIIEDGFDASDAQTGIGSGSREEWCRDT